MRVKIILDLDLLMRPGKAKAAFEKYFAGILPKDEELVKETGLSKANVNEMIAYMVAKTRFEDDGKGKLYKVLGLPQEQKEAGK